MQLMRLWLTALLQLASLGSAVYAQQMPAAVVSDPAPDAANPASMEAPDVLSHGSRMYAVFYLASGAGAHSTVLLVQGFPGNEKNMDLAYSIRRAGWNVLVPFCRGSWGSEGTYSFTHAIEDAQAAVEFLRDGNNVKKYRIDPKQVVLIGHSVGGFVVSYVAARDPGILGVAMIAASNLGPSTMRALSRDPKELHERFRANASRLVGATAEALLEEVKQNADNWDGNPGCHMHEFARQVASGRVAFCRLSEAKTTVSFDDPECYLQRPADRNSMNLNVRKRRPLSAKRNPIMSKSEHLWRSTILHNV